MAAARAGTPDSHALHRAPAPDGHGRPEGDGLDGPDGRVAWGSRRDLLRKRSGARADSLRTDGIRLRRQRRVYAPFSALPSLARTPFDLRKRRRRQRPI